MTIFFITDEKYLLIPFNKSLIIKLQEKATIDSQTLAKQKLIKATKITKKVNNYVRITFSIKFVPIVVQRRIL